VLALRKVLVFHVWAGHEFQGHHQVVSIVHCGRAAGDGEGGGMMDDSRIRRAKADIDDARTILCELADELTDNNLEAARFALNVSIQHLNILEAR